MTRPLNNLTRWLPPALCVIVWAAYANSLSGAFLFDDYPVLLTNPFINNVWPPWEAGQSPHRIVVAWSFAVNYALGGQSVVGYHIGNVLIHTCAALALYGFARRTFALPQIPEWVRGQSRLLAFAGSGLWAAHPLTTQAVTYISQRFESTMALFYLLTLYAFARGAGASSRPWFGLAVLACALGMCCKRVMITAPVIVLVYDWVFLARRDVRAMQPRAVWHVLLFLTPLVPYAINPLVPPESESTALVFSPLGISPVTYALTQLGVVTHYMRLALWPVGQCFDYAWPAAASIHDVIWPGVFLVVLVGCTVIGLWRSPEVAFIGVFFFGILAPTSTIVPIDDFAAEHRVYLPLVAICVGVVLGIARLCSRLGSQADKTRAGLAVCGILILVLAGATHARNRVYRTGLTMWQDILAKQPQNVRAYSGVGAGMLRQGDTAAAIGVIEKGLRRLPDLRGFNYSLDKRGTLTRAQRGEVTEFIRLQTYLGTAHSILGDPGRAESYFRIALSAYPAHVPARANLGVALMNQGQHQEAREAFESVLEQAPDDPAAKQHLATLDSMTAERHGDPSD
jgi:tetratricopeptide (TPR) repeat protein